MTTAHNISFSQIRTLRTEAAQAQDFDMIAICDLAFDGNVDPDDYTTLSLGCARELRTMTPEQARASCAKAIDHAAAQLDCAA